MQIQIGIRWNASFVCKTHYIVLKFKIMISTSNCPVFIKIAHCSIICCS